MPVRNVAIPQIVTFTRFDLPYLSMQEGEKVPDERRKLVVLFLTRNVAEIVGHK
jgi:hypothetical protein